MAKAPAKQKSHEARLLRLAAWILSQPEPVPRAEIYARFPEYKGKPGAAEKMFTRDKDALKRLGFLVETVELGGADGYAIDARASLLPPIELTAEEAAAAWTAGVGALRLSRHPLQAELESALRKLVVGTRSLPPRAAAAEALDAATGAEDGKLLRGLVDAWEKRRRLRISYWRAATGEVVEREVDVYGWARRRGEWIFVGHDHLRDAVRIFYLSRVRALRKVGLPKGEAQRRSQSGKDGDYDVPESFDIRRWSRQQIWDYDVHPPVAAVVRFRGSLAGIARQLIPGARVETDGTGARVARLEVRNLRGLVRQALAWGPDAEVTEPASAREAAREVLASLVEAGTGGTP
jgi:predicted DNA-binding transcriptional regulator YafY